MNDNELRSALLILEKRGEEKRYMYFEDHRTAFDVAAEFKRTGWGYVVIRAEYYAAGEMPAVPKRLF
jgi:hypothetical protein